VSARPLSSDLSPPFASSLTAAPGLSPEQLVSALRAELARPAPLHDSLDTFLSRLLVHSHAQEAAIAWWAKGHVQLAMHAQRAPAPGPAHSFAPQQPPQAATRTATHIADQALWTAAMEEALDQGQCLTWPPQPEHALATLTRCNQALASNDTCRVATLILPDQADAPLGAITLTWRQSAQPPSALDALAWQSLATQIAPLLALQRQAHLSWHARLRRALSAQGRHWLSLRTPRQRTSLGLLAAVALAWLLWPSPARMGGQARVEGAQQSVLVAPVDGFIKAVHAHPGDQVKAGQALADLADQDLKLERERWASQVAQQDNSYAAAMTRADRAEAAQSMSRLEEAQAQLAMIEEQLQRSQLKAPFDGFLIQGDLSQSIGAPVKQGDALLTVASTHQFRVIIDIDERDVARVHIGQHGEMALSALPWDTLPIQVQRITPLAQTREGRNVFEVQARFTQPLPPEVRPGLMGQAWVLAERQPPLWHAIRPVLAQLRWLAWTWGL
jgi:biotin carboxyl carrier protein